eukprot:413406-Rhodomonas_salina.1
MIPGYRVPSRSGRGLPACGEPCAPNLGGRGGATVTHVGTWQGTRVPGTLARDFVETVTIKPEQHTSDAAALGCAQTLATTCTPMELGYNVVTGTRVHSGSTTSSSTSSSIAHGPTGPGLPY